MDALDRNLIDAAFGESGKNLLVLPPFAAERILPVDVGLDAVAVADVDGGGALKPIDGAMQRLDAPAGDFAHKDVESRLIELDDVHAVLFQRARFLVKQAGESHPHLDFV